MAENLELKAHLASLAKATEVAKALPASFAGTLLHTDTYFVVPRGRCKIRDFGDGTAELISYRREEKGSERWSHYIKVPLSEVRPLRDALGLALGELVTVRKSRDLWLYESARIHLDRVEGLGNFIEFEVTSGGETERKELMAMLRKGFGIREVDCLSCSYADLLLASKEEGGRGVAG